MVEEVETKKRLAAHFAKTKHEDSYAALIYGKVVIRFLREFYSNQPTARVLDIGCGTGTLEEHVPAIGIDISMRRLAFAKRAFSAECVLGDANALPVKDQAFDLVHFAATLMHVPDYRGAIREASRVLRRKGILLIYEPNKAYAGASPWGGEGPFYQTFSKQELEALLESEGHRLIRSKYCLSGVPRFQGLLQRRMRWFLLFFERLSIPWLARELFLVSSKEK